MTALAPLAGARLETPALAHSPAGFAPPSAPMVLSRTVIRDLSDGKQIIVKRSFKVQFVASGNGYTLTGAPLGVTVDVPPVLKGLADLERQRSEPGPFPLVVDSRGLIKAESVGSTDRQTHESASRMGSNMLQAAPIADQTKQETIQLLINMASDPRSSPWPVDLFSAKDAERHLHRSVTLADGSAGEVDVVLRVEKWLPCGMPALFERVITTDLSGSHRVSREVWSLEPLAGN
ncbi:MAG: hypothetical protein ACKOQM_14295 [Novosphingobium sp.]